ncbi:hypothetical protein GOP47_0030171 [Adiantum capillus-veneris]|nr:hypothetical protein GOP47_0030171 [Adiantum capillus-veneris]
MESDQGKLFIGGISWETTEEKLKSYFSAFGEVVEAVIMKDRATGRARGFGFIVFSDPMVADMVVLEKHSIDGRMVEAKKAVPRDDQQSASRISNGSAGSPAPSNPARTKKIFVGGLASTVTENDFKKYFGQFGTITDVVVMYDHGTQRPRGFGFITYDSEESVDKVLQKTFHELNEKMVEVKRAVPKELSTGPTRSNGIGLGAGAGSRGSPYTSSYAQAFTPSPIMSYATQIDSRYGSSPSNRGLYSPYGAIGHTSSRIHNGSLNGVYGSSVYGGNASYGGGSYGSGIHGGSYFGAGYGSATNSGSFNNAYNSSPGRNPWGSGGPSYDSLSGSAGFEVNRTSCMSGYGGVGTWGSSQTANSVNPLYENHNYGYEVLDLVIQHGKQPQRINLGLPVLDLEDLEVECMACQGARMAAVKMGGVSMVDMAFQEDSLIEVSKCSLNSKVIMAHLSQACGCCIVALN